MNVSEDALIAWSKGPSQTESDKCDHSETAVRKALKADEHLANLDLSVFAQGSYKARTNVRLNSDVDICIRYNGQFFPDYPPGTSHETFGNRPGTLPFSDFKHMVQTALRNYFGVRGVTRGNKAFDVHANTYRIDADVVPTFEHRRYKQHPDGTYNYLSGVALLTDSGQLIKNWPQQTYDNGVKRNTLTHRKYKRLIRILKRLRDKIQDTTAPAPISTPSFLVECLVWNAELAAFAKDSYTDILRHVLANTWNRTRDDTECRQWGEVNELKYLFGKHQPWTRRRAHDFLQSAWDYVGFK